MQLSGAVYGWVQFRIEPSVWDAILNNQNENMTKITHKHTKQSGFIIY